MARTRVAPPLTVAIVKPDPDGKPKAQIRRGSTFGTATLLSEFDESIQVVLKDLPLYSSIECVEAQNATPATVRPKAGAKPVIPVPPPPSRQQPQAGVEALPVPTPLDCLPFNFAEWLASGSWPNSTLAHSDASQRILSTAQHDKWASRRSGQLEVEFEAQAPIFVPRGAIREDREVPQSDEGFFWRCVNADGEEREAIPGSTVKGVVRTLFEIWTNSRMTVIDEARHQATIPYRRMSPVLFAIIGKTPSGGLNIKRCEVKYGERSVSGQWRVKDYQGNWGPMNGLPDNAEEVERFNPTSNDWQPITARTNLLWSPDHRHKYKCLYVRLTSDARVVDGDAVKAYQDNIEHSSYTDNPDHAGTLPNAPGSGSRNWYLSAAAESTALSSRLEDLRRLEIGDLIYGVPKPSGNQLECFGKNVHFLWPSRYSPADFAKSYQPRNDREANLAGADTAESVFGFAGAHDASDPDRSHPFRSRIRFGTFWRVDGVQLPPTRVGPLLAPSGVRLKARPVYLPPDPSNRRARSYDETGVMLRGRKLYWHQSTMQPAPPPPAPQLGVVTISPWDVGTKFAGVIQFDNLTDIELGALLVSLDPGLFFQPTEGTMWGIKLGKGKALGLGSVTVTSKTLSLRTAHMKDACSTLDALAQPVLHSSDGVIADAVRAFESWLNQRAAEVKSSTAARDLPFVKDLEKLLRMPGPPNRRYVPPGPNYGWPPEVYNPRPPNNNEDRAGRGEPRSGAPRPLAMNKARDIPG